MNEQSRNTGNIGHTRHWKKTNKTKNKLSQKPWVNLGVREGYAVIPTS